MLIISTAQVIGTQIHCVGWCQVYVKSTIGNYFRNVMGCTKAHCLKRRSGAESWNLIPAQDMDPCERERTR